MFKKSIFLMLSTFLLLQAQALPHVGCDADGVAVENQRTNAPVKEVLYSSEESDEDSPHWELVKLKMDESIILAKYIQEKGLPLLRNVLHKLEAVPEKNERLQANITRISNFLNMSEPTEYRTETDEIRSLITSLVTFMEIKQDFEHMPAESELTKTLQEAFVDSGYEKFEKDLLEQSKTAAEHFEKPIERYLNSLTEAQKNKGTKLLEVYNKFKNEQDIKRRDLLLDEFFHYFKY